MVNLKTNNMGKALAGVIGFMCYANAILAQDKTLVVEGVSPNLYITHKIEPKENYYSIGRLYNVAPKELAPFNNLDFEKGLSLGQDIKIPLSQNNFTQEETAKNGEALIPLYHIIEEKEGLYRVSLNYNKVPLQMLKKWNNLSTDVVSNGTKLIVGYLKVQKDKSSLTKNEINVVKDAVTISKQTEPQAKYKTTDPKENVPAVKKPDMIKAADSEVKDKAVINDKTTDAKSVPVTKNNISFNGGQFKSLYEGQHPGKTPVIESGASGVFKSTSGWQDGKYYCFNNSAQPGTIVKITNVANDKSVYAKVLDLIPDINQNSGLILNISNSAAQELGVNDNKFDCTVNYYK